MMSDLRISGSPPVWDTLSPPVSFRGAVAIADQMRASMNGLGVVETSVERESLGRRLPSSSKRAQNLPDNRLLRQNHTIAMTIAPNSTADPDTAPCITWMFWREDALPAFGEPLEINGGLFPVGSEVENAVPNLVFGAVLVEALIKSCEVFARAGPTVLVVPLFSAEGVSV